MRNRETLRYAAVRLQYLGSGFYRRGQEGPASITESIGTFKKGKLAVDTRTVCELYLRIQRLRKYIMNTHGLDEVVGLTVPPKALDEWQRLKSWNLLHSRKNPCSERKMQVDSIWSCT